MRSHGVPNFPDPYMGYLGWSVDSGVDPNTSQFKAAWAYCSAKYVHFPTVTPAQKAQRNAAAAAFSRCMRSHGATDFPDPDGSGAINLPTAYYMRTPLVARARQSCESLVTGKQFVFVSPAP